MLFQGGPSIEHRRLSAERWWGVPQRWEAVCCRWLLRGAWLWRRKWTRKCLLLKYPCSWSSCECSKGVRPVLLPRLTTKSCRRRCQGELPLDLERQWFPTRWSLRNRGFHWASSKARRTCDIFLLSIVMNHLRGSSSTTSSCSLGN